ncbi:MAG: S53 family peptidase [Blastococcus sp.]
MTAPTGKTPLPGSERATLDRPPIGDVPGSEPVDAMVTLRADIDDESLNRVIQFLEDHGLTVANTYRQSRTLHVRGPAAGMQSAFSVRLARYFGESGDQFRGRSGPIYVPDDIAADVTAVLGLDDRKTARPWHAIAPRAGGGAPLTPLQVAKAYKFPAGDGQGQTVGVIELGGAFTQTHLDAYLAGLMVPGVAVTVVPVMGAKPTPDGPNGADGEVMLDVEIIAALAPAANVRVYFGPNTTAGFLAAINQAIVDGADVISISWGGPESTWTHQAMNAYDQTFAAALSGGCSVFAASGDNGSSDGVRRGGKHVDFPASSPHVTGCGGTRLTVDPSGTLTAEVVWNDDPTTSAGGGGFSAFFAKPGYQTTVPGAKRGVPDVAGDADPVTGYPVRVDGQNFVIGGTSAVAPLMSGLTLRLNQIAGRSVGDFNALAYADAGNFSDVTVGNNGAFTAAPGWDPTTGLGSPIGAKVLTALTSSAVTTAGSALTPPVTAPSSSPPMTDDALLDAFRSFRTAVDGLWTALQTWADGRQLSGAAVPSPSGGSPESPAAGVPSQRGNARIPVPEPSS